MDKRPKDYFNWTSPDQVTFTPSRWNLTYEQPGEVLLVQTVNEFLTYCAQRRPGEDPDAVLNELIQSGAILDAPRTILKELSDAGVIVYQNPLFQIVR